MNMNWTNLSNYKDRQVEQYLWNCDISTALNNDLDDDSDTIILKTLLKCMSKYRNSRGILCRVLQLLQDYRLTSLRGIPSEYIDIELLDTIYQLCRDNCKYVDVCVSLMQLLSVICDNSLIINRFNDENHDNSLLIMIHKIVLKHPHAKTVQKASIQAIHDIMEQSHSNYNITCKYIDEVVPSLIYSMTIHQDDEMITMSSCQIMQHYLDTIAATNQQISSSINQDELIYIGLTVISKSIFSEDVMQLLLLILSKVITQQHHLLAIVIPYKHFQSISKLLKNSKACYAVCDIVLKIISDATILGKAIEESGCGSRADFADEVRCMIDGVTVNADRKIVDIVDGIHVVLDAISLRNHELNDRRSVSIPLEEGNCEHVQSEPEAVAASAEETVEAPTPIIPETIVTSAVEGIVNDESISVEETNGSSHQQCDAPADERVRELLEEMITMQSSYESIIKNLNEKRKQEYKWYEELQDIAKTSQEQALLSISRTELLQRLFHDSTTRLQVLLEENDMLRAAAATRAATAIPVATATATATTTAIDKGVDDVSAAIDDTHSTPTVSEQQSVEASCDDTKVDANTTSAPTLLPTNTPLIYQDSLSSLVAAAVIENFKHESICLTSLELFSKSICSLFCHCRLSGVFADQSRNSTISITAFRQCLRDMYILDGKKCKQRDLDILCTQLGIHQKLSIFGFTYMLILCAKNRYGLSLSVQDLMARIIQAVTTYDASYRSSSVSQHNQQHQQQLLLYNPIKFTAIEEQEISKMFDLEKVAISRIFAAYQPNVPRDDRVEGMPSEKVLMFCQDFSLMPEVLQQNHILCLLDNILYSSSSSASSGSNNNTTVSHDEPLLSLIQFQLFLLDIAVKIPLFKGNSTASSSSSSSSSSLCYQLANLFSYLHHSRGPSLILDRDRNVGPVRFKNELLSNEALVIKQEEKISRLKSIELKEKIGPMRKVHGEFNLF